MSKPAERRPNLKLVAMTFHIPEFLAHKIDEEIEARRARAPAIQVSRGDIVREMLSAGLQAAEDAR